MTPGPPFANRVEELAILAGLAPIHRGALVVVYGRRRVGKTALLRRHLDATRGRTLYLYIDHLKREDLLRQLSDDCARQLGIPVSFRGWDDLWKVAGSLGPEPLTIVLDEFQRLRTVSPDALTSLQRAWDENLRHRRVLVVLMGSSIGMVRRVAVDARGALHGRATVVLPLKPFTYAQTRELVPGPETRRLELYATFGGTPHYLSLALGTPGNLWAKVRRLVLLPGAPLREEPLNVLSAELRDPEKYYSVLRAIASGRVTSKEIADTSGVTVNRLTYYLGTLEKLLGIIRRDDPVLGGARTGRYAIEDPFFRFWFRFIHRNMALLEMGDHDTIIADARAQFPAQAGRIFETVVRELVTSYNHHALGSLRIELTDIGAWWDRRGNEIDVCAPMRDGSLLLGEVTWSRRPADASEVADLRKKADLVPHRGTKRLLLVSRNVDPSARAAMGSDGVVLDLDQLGRAFDHRPLPRRSRKR